MEQKKKAFIVAGIYTAAMAIANLIAYFGFQVIYEDPGYVTALLPSLAVMAVGALLYFLKYGKKLPELPNVQRPRLIFHLYAAVVIAIAIYYIGVSAIAGELNVAFFIPLVLALLVGIGEELTFRGVLFERLQASGADLLLAVFVSAIFFGLLHSINVFAGMPVGKMLVQLVTTFLAGLFYALMYAYTRNLVLIIVLHGLWDYLLIGGAMKTLPILTGVLPGLSLVELVIVIVLLVQLRRKTALAPAKAEQ